MNDAADRYSPEIAEAFQKTLTDRPAVTAPERALRRVWMEGDDDAKGAR